MNANTPDSRATIIGGRTLSGLADPQAESGPTPMAEIQSRITIMAERARELGMASDRFYGPRPEVQSTADRKMPDGAYGQVHAALDDLERALTWAEPLTNVA